MNSLVITLGVLDVPITFPCWSQILHAPFWQYLKVLCCTIWLTS